MKLSMLFLVALGTLIVAVAVSGKSHGMDDDANKNGGSAVSTLFESMRSDEYTEGEFPRLGLADVPALLELADSTRRLKSFPRTAFSSQYEAECSEGMVALWLIEGVRQGGKYPSLNSLCFKQGADMTNWTRASEDNHKEVAKLYRAWWEKAEALPDDKAKMIDPLKDSGLVWH
jgi:hypothetical protein